MTARDPVKNKKFEFLKVMVTTFKSLLFKMYQKDFYYSGLCGINEATYSDGFQEYMANNFTERSPNPIRKTNNI